MERRSEVPSGAPTPGRVGDGEYRPARGQLAGNPLGQADQSSFDSPFFKPALLMLVASLSVALLGYALDPGIKRLYWPQLALSLVLVATGLRLASRVRRRCRGFNWPTGSNSSSPISRKPPGRTNGPGGVPTGFGW